MFSGNIPYLIFVKYFCRKPNRYSFHELPNKNRPIFYFDIKNLRNGQKNRQNCANNRHKNIYSEKTCQKQHKNFFYEKFFDLIIDKKFAAKEKFPVKD